MVINHNLAALNALHHYMSFQKQSCAIVERLSSGLRINRAADDPAGFAISERMKAQIRGLHQAQRNAQDAISLVQTMEGGVNEIVSILQRMRELSVKAANGALSDNDRQAIQEEIDQLREGINDIANHTQFNGIGLLNRDGSADHGGSATAKNKLYFQVGANEGNTFRVDLLDVRAKTLGVTGIDVSTRENAGKAISKIDDILDAAISQRSSLGAYQNSLERIGENAANAELNLTAAVSRICDVDIAAEMMQLAKINILIQTSLAILAKANQRAKDVLKLLP